jgi:DNA replication protein DnaC
MSRSPFGLVCLAADEPKGDPSSGREGTHLAETDLHVRSYGERHVRLYADSVDVLILDDFALRALDATETNDFYELIVERHRKASTIVTSNREPAEWLSMMSDALLAQSAVDRLTSGAHTLVIEGPSYRQRTPHRRAAVDDPGPVQ